MEGRPRLKRGRGEGRGGKGKGREGKVGRGPRDILSRGPPVPSYATEQKPLGYYVLLGNLLNQLILPDMKMTDQVAGHEIAGHENDGPNSRA